MRGRWTKTSTGPDPTPTHTLCSHHHLAEYGSSKTAYSYPFSIDNKARYCSLHQYDLNVDVHTGAVGADEEEEAAGAGGDFSAEEFPLEFPSSGQRSSRFRKLELIRSLWDSYDWLVWMDIDALFLDPATDVLSLLDHGVRVAARLRGGGATRAARPHRPPPPTPISLSLLC